MCRLTSLPYEVVAKVADSLSFDDVFSLGRTCKQFLFLLTEDRICKSLLARGFGSVEGARRGRLAGKFDDGTEYRQGEGRLCNALSPKPSNRMYLLPAKRNTLAEIHGNPDKDSTSMSQYPAPNRDGRRGVRGYANDRNIWAFCDTGAGQNIISARMAKQMGLNVKYQPTLFTMGNSKQVNSFGIAHFDWAFSDDPSNIIKIIAHVLDDFKYDCLLGNSFIRATKLMTDHVKRFVKGVFPSRRFWSMNLLGETSQRIQGWLGDYVDMEALPDIGSSRNIMDESWTRSFGFSIRSAAENMGVVVFPDNSTRATIGQVHTTITLRGGAPTPIVFEVLPDCYVPVVLGEDFVFDNDLYTNHASAFVESGDPDSMYDLLPMNYYKKSLISSILPGRKSSSMATPADSRQDPPNEAEELERQRNWNREYSRGRTADQAEWDAEWNRRAEHERRRYPNWEPDEGIAFIEFRPSTRPEPGSSLHSGTSVPGVPITNTSQPQSSMGVDDGRDSVSLQSPSPPDVHPRPSPARTTADSADEHLGVDGPGGGLPSRSSPSVNDQRNPPPSSSSQCSHHLAEHPSSSSSGDFGAEEQSIWGTGT